MNTIQKFSLNRFILIIGKSLVAGKGKKKQEHDHAISKTTTTFIATDQVISYLKDMEKDN